jgi:hypothetical protein
LLPARRLAARADNRAATASTKHRRSRTTKSLSHHKRGVQRRGLLRGLAAAIAIVAGVAQGSGQPAWSSEDTLASEAAGLPSGAFGTTVAYVVQFYPLWFTYHQSRLGGNFNHLVGPVRVSPLYHVVVAINVDTIYASSYLDLSTQPVVLTIPRTNVVYSLLTLDPYGNVFDSGILPQTQGTYVLTGPGFSGTLPAGLTRIKMPLDYSTLIFRADKYTKSGENQIKEALLFRASLKLQTLADYRVDPAGGGTAVLPQIVFAVPFKTTADTLVARAPITFLKQLQTAVEAANTPPLSPYEQALSRRFNKLFGSGDTKQFEFSAGAQAAHDLIINRYLSNTGPTNWIHFRNIGEWGRHVIDRAGITEFIQYANNISAAAYYHAFKDGAGRPLDGTDPLGYALTFRKDQIPMAKRFWSITAYTPQAIELVANPANKYAVASYTPRLMYNTDGSLTVYLAQQLPAGVPYANWLPIPKGAFNIMLRVYGPQGKVEHNAYLPPAIRRQ